MAKVTLEDISSGHAATTLINANNTKVETAFENTLSRDGTGPNQMNANLDMNGFRILNQGNPLSISGFNWEGSWTTSTSYSAGDVVETGGSAYVCVVNHTSGTFLTDLAAVKWQLVAEASFPSQSGKQYYILSTDGVSASWVTSTSFIRTLLDDATAAAARATLGVSYGPAFSAIATSTQSIVSGSITQVTLTEEFDTDNCFASSRFTPNVAGYYLISGILSANATNLSSIAAYIYKNGVAYRSGDFSQFSPISSSVQVSVAALISFNGTSDYVDLRGIASGTSPSFDYASSSDTSVLSGFFVRPL